MSLFKDMLKDNETIFKEEIALDLDFTPPIIKFRENEQQYISICIKPLFQNRNGKNVIITGAPGIGKTVAVKFILEELKKETDAIIPIYINCWKKDTPHKIALEICQHINYRFTQNKDTSTLLNDVFKILNKKSAVIVLDEIDKLLDFNILYSILEDLYRKTLVLITNNKTFLSELDQRIKSRLTAELLEFKPYNFDETSNILKQRTEFAFFPDVLSVEAFSLISQKTFEKKDIRTGIHLLKESGNIAESESSKKILEKHANLAISKLKDMEIKDTDPDLLDKTLLAFIKQHSGKPRKDLFALYSQQHNISYRTFHRKIENLEKLGLISLGARKYGKSNLVNFIKEA